MTEEMPKDERRQLESKVDDAIKRGCSIDFASKDFNMHQIKYIQKCAEIVLFHLDVYLATLILLMAVSASYIVTFASGTDFISFISKNVGLISLLIGGYLFYYNWLPRYNRCKKVILDVEWQIQIPREDEVKE